jgi:predicted amidohydrolase YtcJ
MSLEQVVQATKAGQGLYAAAGITTAHEGATALAQMRTIKQASDAGANLIDVIAFPFITDLDAILAEFPLDTWGSYHDRFKVGGLKITIYGSPQRQTAKSTTPYLTGGPNGETDWSGEMFAPQGVINAAVKRVYDLGVPLDLHANGDAAIDAFFTAHEHAAASGATAT